jgi:4-aminobutyrate aminotransferase
MSIPREPHIVTALPGPRTIALIEKDQAFISPSYTRGYPFAMARGVEAMVQDVDGNWFLDFCAGIAVNSTGHCHPKVVEAITEQAQQFLHMSGTDFYYDNMATLAEKLSQRTGGTPRRVFFANSGTEANEGAMKLARYYTKRPGIISFYRSFHGRTLGSMSVSASKAVQRSHFAPLQAHSFHAHFPDAYRPFFGNATPEAEAQACLDFIEQYLFKMLVSPHDVAAILVEPIQGEGGYIVPPSNWLPGLRKLCDAHGILLIIDEVQAGMGRTGKLWAHQHDGIEADIITSAKGLASGLPLGAIIAKKEIMTWPPGTHATTFGGNPVACAAALATLDLITESLAENAAQQGEALLSALRLIDSPYLGDVRGRGLMVGLEIVEDRLSKTKAPQRRDALVEACYAKGLLVLGCGESSIRLCPPLVITSYNVETAVSIIQEALHA